MLTGRRPPRPQPGRGRAHHRHPPGLRLPERQGRVRHRPPGLRAQDADRTGGAVRRPASGGRPQRLPEPGRVRPRSRRELPRVDLAQLRRRAGQGLCHPRRGPAHGRGDRRRRADRRDGVGGAEQHRDRPGLPTGDRGQRQRPLLHPDRRRADDRAHHAPDQPALRARPRGGQEAAQRRSRRRTRRLRRPARDEEGAQGRAGAAGPLRGPRAQVRRPGRRPRRSGHGARTGAGEAVRRPGDRARDHPQGLRLRRRRAARGRPVPLARALRRRHRRGDAQGPDLDRRVRRRDGAHRHPPPGRRGHHRRDDAPGRAAQVPGPVPRAHVRRRDRRAARRHLGGRPGDGRAAPGRGDLRDVPQPRLRPGADGRRPAPLRGDLRARPRRCHRRRRRQPQRHVGHVRAAGGARPPPGRPARLRPPA